MEAYGIEVRYRVYREVNQDNSPDWFTAKIHTYYANSETNPIKAKAEADLIVLTEWPHAIFDSTRSYGLLPDMKLEAFSYGN